MTLDIIIKQIKEILNFDQKIKIEFYQHEIAFCIYENEIVITYINKNNKLYLDCELADHKLDTSMMEELTQIMKLLDDNKDTLKTFFDINN